MAIKLIIIYLIFGLILSLIYDYHSPNKRCIKQHVMFMLLYPILFSTGMI